MAVKLVSHHNLIGHEINESMEKYGVSDREIYCKRLHKITEPLAEDCDNCPYFDGFLMGHGHECVHEDAKKEFIRVSQLIDQGWIKKG